MSVRQNLSMHQQCRMLVRYSLSLYFVQHLSTAMQIFRQITVLHAVNLFAAALSQCQNPPCVTKTKIQTLLYPVVNRKFRQVKIVMIVIMFNIQGPPALQRIHQLAINRGIYVIIYCTRKRFQKNVAGGRGNCNSPVSKINRRRNVVIVENELKNARRNT